METNLPPPINPGGTPPPLSTPPPIIVQTPPPPRSCTGWKIFAILLLVLLVGSIGLNFLGLIGSIFGGGSGGGTGAQSGKHFHEVVVDNSTAKNKIAVLEVKGMISSEPWGRSGKSIADIIEDQLKWAA